MKSTKQKDEERVRQLANERDFWRRKAEAMDKKYATLKGRAFLAIVAHRSRAGWTGEVLFIDDNSDRVTGRNYMHGLKVDLEASQNPATRKGATA